jgi:hypothetical protein
LLGVIKYIWHVTHTPWSPEQKQTYAIRLQSTNTDGLSIHAIRSNYIMQYAGSLIGRQFKTIAQINVFHVRDLVTDHEFMAWKAAGELAALLWFPEIRNLEEYRVFALCFENQSILLTCIVNSEISKLPSQMFLTSLRP